MYVILGGLARYYAEEFDRSRTEFPVRVHYLRLWYHSASPCVEAVARAHITPSTVALT